MIILVAVDGSQGCEDAMKYAVRTHPHEEFVLAHVAPSGREADLQRGQHLLDSVERICREMNADVKVRTVLTIGDARSRLPEIIVREKADRVVLGAYGMNAFPSIDRISPEAVSLGEGVNPPVMLILPTGEGVSAGHPYGESK